MTSIDRQFFIETLRNIADRLENDKGFSIESVNINIDTERVINHHYFEAPIRENSPTGLFSIEFNLFDGDACNQNMGYVVNELESHINVDVEYIGGF